MPRFLNMPKFWIWEDSQCASIAQRSEYTRICADRVLNISWVLNMPGFWIWQISEYARVTHGSKYTTMPELDVNMPEFTIINRVLNI